MPGRRHFSSLVVLLAGTTLAAPALADPLDPFASDGSGHDNERLRPGIYPAAPVPADFAVPPEPGHPPFDIDWSVGLRGTLTHSAGADSFVTTLNPAFTATHAGVRTDLVLDGSAEIARPGGGELSVTALGLGVSGTYALDGETTLSGNAGIGLSQDLPGTPGLNPVIVEPPAIATGTLGLGIDRSFGLFNLGAGASAVRTVYGTTTRTDTGITDNSDQNLWSTEASLRLGYQVTPIFEVFGQGTIGRDIFDLPSATLLVRPDATERALRAGITGKWNGILEASASIGVGQRDFDAASLGDITTQLYDASLTFTPDPTLSLTAGLSSAIAPPGADATGTARIEHTATAKLDYTVNSWLRLRASADWGISELVGSAETETRYGLGAGADYKVNAHTALSADYGYGHRNNSATGLLDTHTVSLGITVRR